METTPTKIRTTPEARTGFVPGAAQLAIEVVERTQVTALGLLQDVRGELRTVADGAFDAAEKALGAVLRIARKVTHRVDEAVSETLTGAERLVGHVARNARDTTRSATDLASTALDGVVGGRTASA